VRTPSVRQRYRRRPGALVTAVRLALDTVGFRYQKWGRAQKCKRGDWIVDNGQDLYTVDARVFARTYEEVSRGRYRKRTPVWAELALEDGVISTKEGQSRYKAGDYIVFNQRDGRDGYCIAAEMFQELYEPDRKTDGEERTSTAAVGKRRSSA
jgi:hypothetical protein